MCDWPVNFYRWRFLTFQKVLKPLFSPLMVIWGRHWITCKLHTVVSDLSTKKMFSRSHLRNTLVILYISCAFQKSQWAFCWFFSGLWPASSIACKEYGAQCTWREIWWCLLWSQTALWLRLFPHWHNHNLFPYHKKLWYGWVFETGIHEGTSASFIFFFHIVLAVSCVVILSSFS